jgi:uncharacterized Fe-S cluster-containing MiaB family protein
VADSYDVPKCAVCNKKVERFVCNYSLERDGKLFTAYCHGQVEEQFLSAITMVYSTQIEVGLAFQRPLLEDKNNG